MSTFYQALERATLTTSAQGDPGSQKLKWQVRYDDEELIFLINLCFVHCTDVIRPSNLFRPVLWIATLSLYLSLPPGE